MNTEQLISELKSERKKQGISQAEIARLMNTTQATISRIESGKVSVSLEDYHKFRNALGIY